MYGPIDKADKIAFGIVDPPKETVYTKLLESADQTIGVTHHSTGLGKLKVVDDGTEYSIPITDILHEHLSGWRIEKK